MSVGMTYGEQQICLKVIDRGSPKKPESGLRECQCPGGTHADLMKEARISTREHGIDNQKMGRYLTGNEKHKFHAQSNLP